MTAHSHCAWMITAQTPTRKPQHLISISQNSLRVAWPGGFPLSLRPGLETVFWSAEEGCHMLRITHAMLNVHLFHEGPEGNIISIEIASVCATLMCSVSKSDTLFSSPSRIHYARWDTLSRKMLVLSTASKVFTIFVLSHLQWNTQEFKLCWIPVYIRCWNILPHSEMYL